MVSNKNEAGLIPLDLIERRIVLVRGRKVMLDSDLAELYQVRVKSLNLAVRRNINRFPGDFVFQLGKDEMKSLRFQFETSKDEKELEDGRGGRRYLPYVFTEQGVAMLSSVLRSERAALVNVAIMRTFVRLRQLLTTNKEFAEKLLDMEKKYDKQFKIVFDVLKELMEPAYVETEQKPLGFNAES